MLLNARFRLWDSHWFYVKCPFPFLVLRSQFVIETPVSVHLGLPLPLSSGSRPKPTGFHVSTSP